MDEIGFYGAVPVDPHKTESVPLEDLSEFPLGPIEVGPAGNLDGVYCSQYVADCCATIHKSSSICLD